MRILIVDDSKIARLVVKQVLREIGYTDVTEACDGREALEILETERFEMILSDWKMPRLDGLGLVKALRETPHRDVSATRFSSHASGLTCRN